MDELHAFSLGDLIREQRRSRPGDDAVVCGEGRWAYAAFDERINRLARVMVDNGVAAESRVLWLGQNCHRAFETLFACAKLGAVFTPVNWRQSVDELAFVIDDAAPQLAFYQEEEIGGDVRAARDRLTETIRWICHDDGEYEGLLRAGDEHDPEGCVDSGLAVLQMYTAAFDGRPNGALLSHLSILLQDLVLAMVMDLSADDVYLASGPLFHIWTFLNAVATLQVGGKVVVARRVDAENLCRLIDREHVTRGFILEPTRSQMVDANKSGRYDLKSFRSGSGSAEWNAMVTLDTSPWGRRPGMYGQTEVAALITTSSLGGEFTGRHGRSSPLGQVRIVDDADRDVAAGEIGEIVCRGPVVMLGYHNRPELNAHRQRNDWHHTHDLGRREEDGSITFVGPKTHMIKSAAENIYPAEVEGAIASHPSVAAVCVIGVADARWTQSVMAVIVLKAGQTATEEEIVEHCRSRISSYKKPKSVVFVDVLPRHLDGTIDRHAVDAAHGGGGYPGNGGS